MLDTLKVGIPLTQTQHERILKQSAKLDRFFWVQHNQKTGELLFRRVSGLTEMDGESFHRELRWDVPPRYEPNCKLTLEFSVPKFWYGHNIRLLYDFVTPLRHLKTLLDKGFGFKTKAVLPDPLTWKVLRVDVCYAWRFPDQRVAQLFLDSLKRLHYPRKKPVIYPTAILFAGTTYSLKFYLKLPEFKAHDLKELLKAKAALEWVNHLEDLAQGVLRVEATLRPRYLKRHNISTVGDLTRPLHYVEWEGSQPPESETDRDAILWAISSGYLAEMEESDYADLLPGEPGLEDALPIADGLTLSSPPLVVHLNNRVVEYQGGTVTFRQRDNPIAILQFLVTKFVGDNAGMQTVDQVKEKLMQVYKPVKTARLLSFWLYVQKFGTAETKEMFGRDSYYASKRDLKKADVTLIEPPSSKVVTLASRDFLQSFKMEVPSPHVVNPYDDGRCMENIFNFVPKMSGSNR